MTEFVDKMGISGTSIKGTHSTSTNKNEVAPSETPSPEQQFVGDIEKKIGFFGRYASCLATLPHNYIELLKETILLVLLL